MAVAKKVQETAVVKMWSGVEVDLLRPDRAQILIDDIATHLSRINRFTGGTSRRYTVAEHCILGLEFTSDYNQLEYLMHDATEAYLGDVSGPLKASLGMEPYRRLEERWRVAIARRFGLSAVVPHQVHVVDQCMLKTEQRDLMGRPPLSTDDWRPYRMRIPPQEPADEVLMADFLSLFYAYSEHVVGAKR